MKLTEDERNYLMSNVEGDLDTEREDMVLSYLEGKELTWMEEKIKWKEELLKKLEEAEFIHEPETS